MGASLTEEHDAQRADEESRRQETAWRSAAARQWENERAEREKKGQPGSG